MKPSGKIVYEVELLEEGPVLSIRNDMTGEAGQLAVAFGMVAGAVAADYQRTSTAAGVCQCGCMDVCYHGGVKQAAKKVLAADCVVIVNDG